MDSGEYNWPDGKGFLSFRHNKRNIEKNSAYIRINGYSPCGIDDQRVQKQPAPIDRLEQRHGKFDSLRWHSAVLRGRRSEIEKRYWLTISQLCIENALKYEAFSKSFAIDSFIRVKLSHTGFTFAKNHQCSSTYFRYPNINVIILFALKLFEYDKMHIVHF